ncbi:MAG: hypothetical protein MTP17_03070 [Candidatus Midichloria sp.]|nr:MAG: hypothetical protein MTP17_03070 [Candidatus Midichloria sp.]
MDDITKEIASSAKKMASATETKVSIKQTDQYTYQKMQDQDLGKRPVDCILKEVL